MGIWGRGYLKKAFNKADTKFAIIHKQFATFEFSLMKPIKHTLTTLQTSIQTEFTTLATKTNAAHKN